MQLSDESVGAVTTSPRKKRRLKPILLITGLVLLVMGPVVFVARWGKSRDAARRELEQKGIPYSEVAFFESARHGEADTVKLFLVAGMNPDARNEKGDTVLMNALGANADAVVEVLLKGGADPNARTSNASTALHLAALTGNAPGGQLLVTYKADVNAKTDIGETPLMIAALRGYAELVKIFLRAGADVNAKDNRGDTPLMHAVERNHTEVIEILRSAGAKE